MQAQTPFEETRRHFFRHCGVGLGKIALASLLCGSARKAFAASGTARLAETPSQLPHFRPRVKSVIHLFMAGAPSQLDLYDPKPKLRELEGKPIPSSVVKDQRYAFIRPDSSLLGPRFKFQRHGQSGTSLADVLPHTAKVVDELTMIKSMTTDQFNHAPAQLFLNTGSGLPGRPSIGAWCTYGLGSETDDLPGFVVLSTGGGTSGGNANWSSGFLPGSHAGVPFRSQGAPILNVASPAGVDREMERASLNLMADLNQKRFETVGDPSIRTRIDAYEMAFRMQTRAPELTDLSSESASTLRDYGVEPGKPSFAAHCLLARRLVERGVRFINVYHNGWDHHSNVEGGLRSQCRQTDQASAALIRDLKQRGLLDETLVIWGGEFGRTPMVEASASLGRKLGRDHHPQAFTTWLAGGGMQPGLSIGETDELGFHVVKDPIHVHDLQATLLHQLGLDHERLTYRTQGREFRLTDVHGKVIDSILR